MNIIEAMNARKSIRGFKSDPVDQTTITEERLNGIEQDLGQPVSIQQEDTTGAGQIDSRVGKGINVEESAGLQDMTPGGEVPPEVHIPERSSQKDGEQEQPDQRQTGQPGLRQPAFFR